LFSNSFLILKNLSDESVTLNRFEKNSILDDDRNDVFECYYS
jgi:hypothetical protein